MPNILARSIRVLLLAATTLATCASGAAAQTTTFGGEVRPRWENRTGTEPFVSMRTRAQLSHTRERVAVLVQIQDVRLWGEESSTSGDFVADALDMHQAWLTVGGQSTWLRAGRQEVSFGEERLIGALNWMQQGRAFDGIRLHVPAGGIGFDAIGMQIRESASAPVPQRELGGAYATWIADPMRAEAFILADGHDAWRWTGGGRVLGRTAGFDWRAEGALQRGALDAAGAVPAIDVAAWMLGASVGRDVGPIGVTLWYDLLSGDDDPLDGTRRVFDTLFGTNHRYYGYADVFTDIPAHTGGRGLQDAALIFDGVAGRTTIELALHRFDAPRSDGLASSHFGDEMDLTFAHPIAEGLRLSAGASRVDVGPALEAVRDFDDDARWFGYLMLDALF